MKKVALILTLILIGFFAFMTGLILSGQFSFNITSSVPRGIWYKSKGPVMKGCYVQVPWTAFQHRSWVPADYPAIQNKGESTMFLKQVVGLPGDVVSLSQSGPRLAVNGMPVANSWPLEKDRLGHELQKPVFPLVLKENEVWTMGTASPYSFDSRYLGPVDLEQCQVMQPFITW